MIILGWAFPPEKFCLGVRKKRLRRLTDRKGHRRWGPLKNGNNKSKGAVS
jgi:hypothetical protein